MALTTMQRVATTATTTTSSNTNENARFVSSKEVPGFDALMKGGGGGFDDGFFNNDASNWALRRSSLSRASNPFAVPVIDIYQSPAAFSRGSIALDLEGFDEKKLPFSPFSSSPVAGKEAGMIMMGTAENNSSNHRRRSSFSDISDLSDMKQRISELSSFNKRESQSTFLSSGDDTFDSDMDILLKKRARDKKKEEDADENKNMLDDDNKHNCPAPGKRIPDDRPPSYSKTNDPSTTMAMFRGSFALDLHGFAPPPFGSPSDGDKAGGNRLRRRSSFSDLRGDSTIDDDLDNLIKKRAQDKKEKEDIVESNDKIDILDNDDRVLPTTSRRRPDDRAPEKRVPRRKRINRSKSSDGGITQPSTHNNNNNNNNNNQHQQRRPRRTRSTDAPFTMKDESEGGRSLASRLHGSKPSLAMKDESARTEATTKSFPVTSTRRNNNRDDGKIKNKEDKKHKSLSALLKDESMGGGSGRTHETSNTRNRSNNKKITKSSNRGGGGRTKRTENRKERSSAPIATAPGIISSSSSRLHQSSGSIFSEASVTSKKSAGSLETNGAVAPAGAGFRRTASQGLEQKAIPERPVAKGLANILSSKVGGGPETQDNVGVAAPTGTGFRGSSNSAEEKVIADRPVAKAIAHILSELPELHRTETLDNEMDESYRTHESTRTYESARSYDTHESSRTHESHSKSRSPKRSNHQSSRSNSPKRRSGGGGAKGKSSRGAERDRSRSNSRSRKNKAAAAAADTPLLGAKIEPDHSECDDNDALFDQVSIDTSHSKTRTTTRHKNKKSSESGMEASFRSNNSRGKGLRRVKSADVDLPLRRDKASASTRTGRSDDNKARRGRRTGSVEAPRGRRTGSVERPRRAESVEASNRRSGSLDGPKMRRTGSVEVPKLPRTGTVEVPRRRAPSHEPRGRAPSQEPKLRRTGSVEVPRRRAPSHEPRGRGPGRRAPSQEPRRRAPSHDPRAAQLVAAIPEPSFKTQPDVTEVGTGTTAMEEDVAAALTPPANLPSISGLTGGEVPAWKMQGNMKSKAQPRDQDAPKEKKSASNKARRFTQAIWKSKIKEAKSK